MQEEALLVLGIDLSYDITQVSVMRPNSAEPEPLYTDAGKRMEFFPTALFIKPSGEKSLQPVQTNEKPTRFLEDALSDGAKNRNGRELLADFLHLLLRHVRNTYEDCAIGFLAITCEDHDFKTVENVLIPSLLSFSFQREQLLVLSHMEAFFHFAIRQEEALWKEGSAAFDYTSEGLYFYRMEYKASGGRRLLVADAQDFHEQLETAENETDKERNAVLFEQLAAEVLQQKTFPLYVTGRSFEGEWFSDALRRLSVNRRVFRGQNLYTQGACFAASEYLRRDKNIDLSILLPDQIAVDVYLYAETVDGESEVLLAKTGQRYEEVSSVLELILDSTDKLMFRIVPIGDTAVTVKFSPFELVPRPEHTGRYELRLFFVKKDCIVVQLKDIGFGDFYQSSCQIYEELIPLSQMRI